MPEKQYVYRSPDGVLRGTFTKYAKVCPYCEGTDIRSHGDFDECVKCGARIREAKPGDKCAQMWTRKDTEKAAAKKPGILKGKGKR